MTAGRVALEPALGGDAPRVTNGTLKRAASDTSTSRSHYGSSRRAEAHGHAC